ncbi:MAG TPA: TIGR02266 family protein [Myxococcota bacterium]|nr:TIGR02266 family protein [Myxococcota bacterium]HRY94395.1 TIGR02266 family protein [Myxococcota bacterium]HSA19991.1 TIGR02266 family protein [Myxococcota bacterium]
MDESYASLLEAFDALNRRKREDADSLSGEERERWKRLRREIEQALFDHSVDPAHDTREHLRVPVAMSVRFRTQNELKDRYIPVLGDGGLFISSVDPLPVGSPLELEILLAHRGLSFQVTGRVVYASDSADPACRGMGVRFEGLSYEQKRMVYGLVDDCLRERLLERRRHARVDAQLEVQFLFADGFFEETTDDLSMGGLFIASERVLPVGERLRLVLHVPGERPAVKALAEVMRVRAEAAPGKPRGMGVRFVELTPEDQETLRAFLTRALALEVPLAEGEPGGPLEGSGANRRLHPRMEHRIPLRFHWLHSFGVCCAQDISTGGVLLQSREAPPPAGSPVEVTLTHPVTLQTLVVGGTVVRVVPPDPSRPEGLPAAAVEFEPLGPAREALLRSILEYYVQVDFRAGDPTRGD